VSIEAEKKATEMKKLLGQVRAQIEKVNEQYKAKANKNHTHLQFQLEDLIWLHLSNKRFPSKRKSKFMAKGEGPYKIVQKVRDNAHKIELPGKINTSVTLNVGDLTP